ncbi:MAG: hypothetical protein R2688_08505 [Fimbriimonadaceae bacterium]
MKFSWQWAEILWWETVSQYGYQEIRTPIFEDIDLFLPPPAKPATSCRRRCTISMTKANGISPFALK